MHTIETARGHAVVMQPGDGTSYWQPMPANGHADPTLFPDNTRFPELSMGFQTVAPGSRIPEHAQDDYIELQICFRGRGRVVVDGVAHDLVPGTACFLGPDVKHEIRNEGPEELVMLWVVRLPAWARGLLPGDWTGPPAGRAGPSALRAPGGRRPDGARDRTAPVHLN